MKIWDSRACELHRDTLGVRSVECILGSFGALCKISDVNIGFSKGCCSPSDYPISTHPYRKHIFGTNTGCYFFRLSAKF